VGCVANFAPRDDAAFHTRVGGWSYTFPAVPSNALPETVFATGHEMQRNDTHIVLKYYMPAIAPGKRNGTFLAPFTVGVGGNEGQILLQTLHGQAAGLPDIVEPDGGGGITVLINETKKG
jgi:hypothetical protein